MNSYQSFEHDVLIIGSGGAGLSLALQLPKSTHVAVLSKFDLQHCNTYYAQGGISAVLESEDTLESHAVRVVAKWWRCERTRSGRTYPVVTGQETEADL